MPYQQDVDVNEEPIHEQVSDVAPTRGRERVKRAMEVEAAGGPTIVKDVLKLRHN